MTEAYQQTGDAATIERAPTPAETAANKQRKPTNLLFKKALKTPKQPVELLSRQQTTSILSRQYGPQIISRHLLTNVLLRLADKSEATPDTYFAFLAATKEHTRVRNLSQTTKKSLRDTEDALLGATALAAPYFQMFDTVGDYGREYERLFVQPRKDDEDFTTVYGTGVSAGREAFMEEIFEPTAERNDALLTELQRYKGLFKPEITITADRLARLMLLYPELPQTTA